MFRRECEVTDLASQPAQKLHNSMKEEDDMKPSTKDQLEGRFHEVKGKERRRWEELPTPPMSKLKARTRKSPARSKRRLARLKRSSAVKPVVSVGVVGVISQRRLSQSAV